MSVKLDFPFLPPSVNSAYVYKNGGRFPKQSYNAFLGALQGVIYEQATHVPKGNKKRLETLKGALKVEVNFYHKTKRKQDIDNRLKVLFDCLTKCGVWEDDDQVVSLVVEKRIGTGEDATVVLITECDPL